MYIVPKSTNESRAHDAPEPAWGRQMHRWRDVTFLTTRNTKFDLDTLHGKMRLHVPQASDKNWHRNNTLLLVDDRKYVKNKKLTHLQAISDVLVSMESHEKDIQNILKQ